MDLIVATSKNWAIGRDNDLLFSIKTDMKYFREHTLGKTVILGRRNLDSFPGGKPLPKRTNLVLTRNPQFEREGVIVFHHPEKILEYVRELPEDDVMVIGGAEIYRMFLPYCKRAYITRVDTAIDDADCFFPNLDEAPDWNLVSVSEDQEENGHTFRFCLYERQKETSPKA